MKETELLKNVSPRVLEQIRAEAQAVAARSRRGQLLCDNCHGAITGDDYLAVVEVEFQSGSATELGRIKIFHSSEDCADIYTSRIDLDPALRYELLLPKDLAHLADQ